MEEIKIARATTLDTFWKYLNEFSCCTVNFRTRLHRKAEVKIISDYRVFAISSFM